MELLGPYMRRRRDELGISLRDFAKQLGKSPAFISDIERGNRNPSAKVLIDVAGILGANLEDFRAMDARPPLADIKRLAQEDPRYAVAFRALIDKGVSPNELLALAGRTRRSKQQKDRKC